MLEVISRLFELLLRGAKGAYTWREAERKDLFGKQLLACYQDLLEVNAAGVKIVHELAYFVDRANRYQVSGAAFTHGTWEIRVLCNRQGHNLDRLTSDVWPIARALDVFSPEVGQELLDLVWGKTHTLWCLTNLVGTGHYYLGTEAALLSAGRSPNTRAYEALKGDSIFLSAEWDLRDLPLVERYLQQRDPTTQLARLQRCAPELRRLIVDNFSLNEILRSIDDVGSTRGSVFDEDVRRSTWLYRDGTGNG